MISILLRLGSCMGESSSLLPPLLCSSGVYVLTHHTFATDIHPSDATLASQAATRSMA